MSNPEDYIVTEELVSTAYHSLQAVQSKKDGQPYLLKRFFRLNAQGIASLRSGMQLARELHLDIILEPVEFFEHGLHASILYLSLIHI